MAKRGFRIASPRQSTLNRSVRQGMAPVQIRILNPWEGFTPDVSYHGLTATGTSGWRGLMVWGEFLLTRDGFEALRDDQGELRFGFAPLLPGYNEATVGGGGDRIWAPHSRFVAVSNEQPIAVIGWYFNSRVRPGRREAFIITHTTTRAAAGTVGTPHPQSNGFFHRRLDGKFAWTTTAFLEDAGVGVVADNRDSPPRWTTDEIIDWALFTRDIPGFTITEPYVIFCAEDPGPGGTSTTTEGGETVMVFPTPTSATNFTSMAVIAGRLEADVAPGGVSQDADVITGINARSLTVFDSRAMYLATVENLAVPGTATDHPRRIRWSAIGHPFILDPGYQNNAGTIFGVGAGFMDLDEFKGKGVKIEVMGRTAVAAYFDDGVAFLRRTGQPEIAFEREIISTKRGLLSLRALSNVGEGVHFGIFTDGWFFLDESGEWTEVGRSQAKGGQSVYKWKETFYRNLLRAETHKIAVAYDPLRKMIQVAWPSSDSDGADDELNLVWYYDIASDRVFENTYVEDYATDMTPRAWGVVPPDIHEPAGLTPSHIVDAYDEQANERIVVHGDQLGRVYAQDVVFHQYDQQNIAWDIELKDTAFGLDPFVIKTLDRIWFEYETVGNNLGAPHPAPNDACESFTVEITSDGGQPTVPALLPVTLQTQDAVPPAEGGGEIRVAQLSLRRQGAGVVGHRFTIELDGIGNVKFLSIRIQVLVGEERGIGSHAKDSGGTAI